LPGQETLSAETSAQVAVIERVARGIERPHQYRADLGVRRPRIMTMPSSS
jgi:hypothetical protein